MLFSLGQLQGSRACDQGDLYAILTTEQLNSLKTEKQTNGKTLVGVHSYDILANPLYLDDLQYVTAKEDDHAGILITLPHFFPSHSFFLIRYLSHPHN